MGNKVTFNTNINCASCYANVEKAFEGKKLYNDFQVDFANPKKPATFTLNEGVKTDQIRKLIKEAGYKAEVVDETNFLRKIFSKKNA
ncbi:MAG: heavy-metal-associated domain-containing protein [Sphingobacteriales bacterium]|nr:MAG: heavy-metal-associated domain-containing protein [Sphingobacteriales bacterium]